MVRPPPFTDKMQKIIFLLDNPVITCYIYSVLNKECKMKLTKEQRNQIWFKMTLTMPKDPYKKIVVRLLGRARNGDAKAVRQLKILGQHRMTMNKYYLTRM